MQTCSHHMTATSVTQRLHANHPSLKVATCIQPLSISLSKQLRHAFRPASTQLRWLLRRRPPLRASQATPMPTTVTAAAGASKAASGNAAHVKAAFAEAGLSQDAIDHILAQYPFYLRWDVEQKLLPAMQPKQQKLGAEFPSEFRRFPKMLLTSTEVMVKARTARKAVKAKAAIGNASSVKAAFAEAGLSQHAIDHILTQYPTYLRWDVGQKLLPAMQHWQQELDDQFIFEFERTPPLLHRAPEEEQLKDQYLVSIGIRSPQKLRKRNPALLKQSLSTMQSKVAFLQQCGFTQAQVTSLVEQHPDILSRPSERVEELLRVVGDMFGCSQDIDVLCDVMLSCKHIGFFCTSPTALRNNLTYFCTCIGPKDKQKQRAWKHGVFTSSPAELDIRLDSIAAQLDATLDEAKGLVRRVPEIVNLLPATVALHVRQLLGLEFSLGQVKSMCLRQPVLLKYNYKSDVHIAKWAFLTLVLQLSHDAFVAKPHLLMSSLPNRMGPRWEYLQQLKLHGVIAFAGAHEVVNSLVYMTDSKFRAAHTRPQMHVYDEHFQKQWQQRWDLLLVDQQLSFQDIADNPALLHISLKDTYDPTGLLYC